jgi:hypothetical protein
MKHHYILKPLLLLYIATVAFFQGAYSQVVNYTLVNNLNILTVKMKVTGSNLTIPAGTAGPSLEFFITWPKSVSVALGTPAINSANLPGLPNFVINTLDTSGSFNYAGLYTFGQYSSPVTFTAGVEYDVMSIKVTGSGVTDFNLKANQSTGIPWYATLYGVTGLNYASEGTGIQPFYGPATTLVGNEATSNLLNVPLPITLGNFTVSYSRNAGAVRADWQTLQENNCSHFVVERSADGINFIPAGIVTTMARDGNSSIPLYYSFADRNYYSGISYYRLKMVKTDGNSLYSMVKSVTISDMVQPLLHIWPNPVNTLLNVEFNQSGALSLTMYNTDGKIVQSTKLTVTAGQKHVLNTSRLAGGVYFLEVLYADGKRIIEKVIKE